MERIGCDVVLEKEKKVFGYLLKEVVDFDKKELKGYIVVEYETEQEYFVSTKNISAYADVLMATGQADFESVFYDYEYRKRVISQDGKDFGVIQKYIFKREKLQKICTNLCEIPAKYISGSGSNAVFLSFGRRKKFPRSSNEGIKVNIMANTSNPVRIGISSAQFAKRVATKTLLGINNEVIVRAGERINKQIVEKAKLHNMLNELFFISKNEE